MASNLGKRIRKHYKTDIIALGRNCIVCGDPMFSTTDVTLAKRDNKIYCTHTCQRNALRMQAFTFITKKKNK